MTTEQPKQDAKPAEPKPAAPKKSALVGLLLVAAVALAAVVWLLVARRPSGREVVVEVLPEEKGAEVAVYTSEVIDAINERNIQAEVGRRYKVIIEDESREGTAGIARIGGLVTFVKGGDVGDIVIIEVTRVKKTTADAMVIKKLDKVEPVMIERKRPATRDRDAAPRKDGETTLKAGTVYSATVEDEGKKGDGIVKVNGKVVFLPGAKKGQSVSFRIVEDMGRFAQGEVVEGDAAVNAQPAGEASAAPAAEPVAKPAAAEAQDESAVRDGASSQADDVQPGRVFDVLVVERDKKTPDVNGVARIGGLVVFVPNSQPGDEVRIRITDRRQRFAFSETLENKGQIELKQ